MTEEKQKLLAEFKFARYIQLATMAICLNRKIGGNQYRHMVDTFAIAINYGHIDNILLKACLVHDLLEDIENFDHNLIITADEDGPEVYKLVMEVSKGPVESKESFLKRIFYEGSNNAMILKASDRIANLKDIGLSINKEFIQRYCSESEKYVLPISDRVDTDMSTEIKHLIESRRKLLVILEH